MKRRRRYWILLALSACGQRVSAEDGATDVAANDAVDGSSARDVLDAARDVATDTADASDATDAADVTDVADVADAGDGAIVVPCDPERPAPAGVGRSCTAANAAQCQEVHYCGGAFRAGHPMALVQTPFTAGSEPFRACDHYTAVARSGYVDAHEVTVARFRRWIDAGRPRPAVGERIAPGITWDRLTDQDFPSVRFPSYVANPMGLQHPGIGAEACTWTPTPGANENLPVNCVHSGLAMAFCWWDGKQLMNDVAWEYLATNRGRTEVSFGSSVVDGTLCDLADVGARAEGATPGSTLGPRRTLPLPFDARPRDVTSDPAGIFGLYGGMREWVLDSLPNPPGLLARNRGTCTAPFPNLVVEGAGRWEVESNLLRLRSYDLVAVSQRGSSWFDRRTDLDRWRYATSRPNEVVPSTGADQGFRCQRWERPL
jgi:hypothetical protein